MRLALLFALLHHCHGYITYTNVKHPLKGERPSPGSPWPLPRSWIRTITSLTLNPDGFELRSPSSKSCDIIEEALLRYRGLIFHSPAIKPSPNHKELEALKVHVSDPYCGYPKLYDDEHYTLSIPSYGNAATLKAKTVWGALRGLETFSQLVYQHPESGHYLVNATTIEDWPRFPYRGLMVDTARHFIPVHVLLNNLDAMVFNKMNVFHWHLSDDQSFPLESLIYPNLTIMGAFSQKHFYRQNDVRRIIAEARLRGIRVVPEIDTPGHSQALGKAFPKLLTACYVGDEPFQAKEGFHGEAQVLNPSRNYTYQFLESLLTEIRQLFADEYIHLGLNEVDHDCWASNPEIREFMLREGLSSLTEVEQFYIRQLTNKVKEISFKQMIWQDPVDKGISIGNDTIVQVWKDSGNDPKLYPLPWQEYIRPIAKNRHKIVLSACWYLNMISYGDDWKKLYKCDPRSFDGTSEDKEYVIGGEACYWTEYIDQSNFLSRLWPRASAVAERLWSHPRDTNSTDDAQFRLDEQRCRMLRRGIQSEPILPGFCGTYELLNNSAQSLWPFRWIQTILSVKITIFIRKIYQ